MRALFMRIAYNAIDKYVNAVSTTISFAYALVIDAVSATIVKVKG